MTLSGGGLRGSTKKDINRGDGSLPCQGGKEKAGFVLPRNIAPVNLKGMAPKKSRRGGKRSGNADAGMGGKDVQDETRQRDLKGNISSGQRETGEGKTKSRLSQSGDHETART